MHKLQKLGLLSLASALTLGTVGLGNINVFAEEVSSADDCANVTDESVFYSCVNAGLTPIILGGDIALTGGIATANNGHDITLNLAGHTLSRYDTVILADNGKFTVISEDADGNALEGGLIKSEHSTAVGVWGQPAGATTSSQVDITGVTLTGGDVSNAFAVVVYPDKATKTTAENVVINLTDVVIESRHGMTIHGNVNMDSNFPQINITGGAIHADESVGVGIFAAGTGDFTITDAEIIASTAIGAKAGTFTFNDATVKSTGAKDDQVQTKDSGIDPSGATFQIEDNPAYAGDVEITINGGTYTSENFTAFFEYPDAEVGGLSSIEITDGEFTVAPGEEIFTGVISADKVEVSGGSFKDADGEVVTLPEDMLADNVSQDEDGNIVDDAPTTSSRPSRPSSKPSDDDNKDEEADETNETDGPEQVFAIMSDSEKSVDLSKAGATLTLRIDADYKLFQKSGKVYVDNKELSVRDFTSRSGSTVIELSNAYLATLPNGEHVAKVTFGDQGYATAKFTVAGSNAIAPDAPGAGVLGGLTSATGVRIGFGILALGAAVIGIFFVVRRAMLRVEDEE